MSQRYIGGLIYNPPGGFSGYFDGSGDYLGVAYNSTFVLNADFTMEAWIFPTASAQQAIAGMIDSGGLTNWDFYVLSGNTVRFRWINSSVTVYSITSSAISLNQWTHVAATLSGTTLTLYVNGVSAGTTTVAGSARSGSYPIGIGAPGAYAGEYFTGYISNYRFVKGSVVYTSAFNPPSGQLQAITNTSLLTCAYSTFRDGSTNNFTITVNGNTAVSTQNPFPLTTVPNPALGNAGNGVYSMSQYQALKQQGLWPAIDPYWRYVTLMLHGNGTNGAQNNTFLDSSTNNFTITRNGNTTQGTFAPYGSNWGNYFNGSSDYLSFADNTAFNFGTGDATVEFWFNSPGTSNNYPGIISSVDYNTSGSASIRFDNTGYKNKVFMYVNSGGNPVISSTSTIAYNTWAHVAIVRQGTSLKLYLNGTLDTSVTISASLVWYLSYGGMRIGRGFDVDGGNAYFPGYVSNVRLVKGTAVYTSNFTPPASPLTAITNTSLLTCQSNRFIDNSSNAFALTVNGSPSVQRFSPFPPTAPYAAGTDGGSGYFDGSGDYLTAPNNTAFDLSTSDFTISYWIYPTSTSAFTMIATYANGFAQNSNYCFSTSMNSGGAIRFDNFSGNSQLTVTGGSVVVNTWNFVTITRSGASATVYVNNSGTTGTVYATSNIPSSSVLYVGAQPDASNPFSGYIGGFRIVKGTATAPGANPTTPLTAITNTSLLLNFTNAGIIDNAEMNDLETVGNAQISTAQSKFGGGSIWPNGSYCVTRASPNFAFGTGDFTLECWAYFTSVANFPTLTDSRATSASTAGFNLGLSSAKVQLYTTSQLLIGATTLSANTWYHIAVTRSGSTLRIFVNGTQDASTTNSTNWSDQTMIIGATPDFLNVMTGYIDDLRITKGYARYTSSFTPQRSQWQDQ